MWVFLKDSFLSIVADRGHKDRLLVRARIKGDLCLIELFLRRSLVAEQHSVICPAAQQMRPCAHDRAILIARVCDHPERFLDRLKSRMILPQRVVAIRLTDQALRHIPAITGRQGGDIAVVILLQRFLITLLKVQSQAQEVVRSGIQVRQGRRSDQGMGLVDRGELRPSKSHDLRIVPQEEVFPPIHDTFTQGPAQCFPFDHRDTCAVELGEVADQGGDPQFEELATRKKRQVCSSRLFWLK